VGLAKSQMKVFKFKFGSKDSKLEKFEGCFIKTVVDFIGFLLC